MKAELLAALIRKQCLNYNIKIHQNPNEILQKIHIRVSIKNDAVL